MDRGTCECQQWPGCTLASNHDIELFESCIFGIELLYTGNHGACYNLFYRIGDGKDL